MKIICVGRNYRDHAAELQNEAPTEPVLFLKPETALILKNQPFFVPDFSQQVHYEVELVVRINRFGKHIDARFAHKYYDEMALGIDFTARDLQLALKEKGLPWEKAKAFDGSAYLGPFFSAQAWKDGASPTFCLRKNEELVQQGHASDMIFDIHTLISYISTFFTLKIGDLIYTGTPAGVGSVAPGDQLSLELNGEKAGSLRVK